MADEPKPYLLARLVMTVELDADGTRMFGMNINTADGERYVPSKMYDLAAMLTLAQVNLGDPEWREVAYPDGTEDA